MEQVKLTTTKEIENLEAVKKEVLSILAKTLPRNTQIIVKKTKSFYKNELHELKIAFCPSLHAINGVSGQYPQVVSLRLDVEAWELEPQVYGGNGGQHIYRKPNLNHPNEKYLAMKGVKIPFRKPKAEQKFVLKALERFAQRYIETLKENIDVLMYSELIDYDEWLNKP